MLRNLFGVAAHSGKVAPTAVTAKVAHLPPFNSQDGGIVMHHQGGGAACGVHSKAVLSYGGRARVSK